MDIEHARHNLDAYFLLKLNQAKLETPANGLLYV